MKILYPIPVLLLMAGCTSTPESAPEKRVALAPTRAPKPTATPITIQSNEVAPPPMNQPTGDSTVRVTSRQRRASTVWETLTPKESRYFKHLIEVEARIKSAINRYTSGGSVKASAAEIEKAYQSSIRFHTVPEPFLRSHATMTDALSQMRTAFIKIQNAEARGSSFLKNEGDTDLFRGLQRQDDARRQIKKDLVANWDSQGLHY